MRRILLLTMLLSAMSLAVQAEDGLKLGEPGYGGTGCPAGTASVILSPDQQSISILFDSFTMEAGGQTQRTADRKNCNIAIPVKIPQGYSISLFSVDYRGFNFLPSGARSQFNVEYFFNGMRGPRFAKNFFGPLNDNYTISHELEAEAVVWSACGASTNLRIATSMLTQTNFRREQTMSSVDSADIQAGMIYHIQWRRCR